MFFDSFLVVAGTSVLHGPHQLGLRFLCRHGNELVTATAALIIVQASLKNYEEAHSDAQKVVELKPEWPKGYSRLGAALYGLERLDEAIEAYDKGLELDPNNS